MFNMYHCIHFYTPQARDTLGALEEMLKEAKAAANEETLEIMHHVNFNRHAHFFYHPALYYFQPIIWSFIMH